MVQRIRMLKDVAGKWRFFPAGTVLRIPVHVNEVTALNWIRAGLAEEDKMIETVPETKAEPAVAKRGGRKKCQTS